MKTLIILTALAALVPSNFAIGQTSKVLKTVGYTTQILKPKVVNYVGFNVLTPTLAAGIISGISLDGLTLTDSSASHTSVLPAGKMFTIEITSGRATGAVREFNSLTSTSVSISAAIGSLAIGDKYLIRKNATLQEMFPLGAPLTGAKVNPNTADIVRVPDGIGGYTMYWYKTSAEKGAEGWWTTVDETTRGVRVTEDIPLLYTDGILINRRAGDAVALILIGEVKTTDSTIYILQGSNVISINSPTGSTLKNSGFEKSFNSGLTTPAAADILWVPNGKGSLIGYWYKTSETDGAIGWWTTVDGTTRGVQVTRSVALPPNCFIERRGLAKFMRISVPSSYSKL